MTDPFAVETPTQRHILLVAVFAYLALFAAELSTDSTLAAGAGDLLMAAIVVPASVVVFRRSTSGPETDQLGAATALALFVAGVAIGYEGIATLELVPRIFGVELVGTVALLVAFGLYLYRSP